MKTTKMLTVYIIFAFLLTSFAGCGKLKNSPISGLDQSETSNLPAQISEPTNTSIKDLTEEEIFERAEREKVEILERELKLFNPKDSYGYKMHQIVIDHRNSLVAQLMDVRRDYYNYLLKGKNNSEK
jgi:hypothetical protein